MYLINCSSIHHSHSSIWIHHCSATGFARKLFAAPYQPRPFSFSVRPDTDRCAEGVVSIEDATTAPVWTMCARRSQQTMKFPGRNVWRTAWWFPKEWWFIVDLHIEQIEHGFFKGNHPHLLGGDRNQGASQLGYWWWLMTILDVESWLIGGLELVFQIDSSSENCLVVWNIVLIFSIYKLGMS